MGKVILPVYFVLDYHLLTVPELKESVKRELEGFIRHFSGDALARAIVRPMIFWAQPQSLPIDLSLSDEQVDAIDQYFEASVTDVRGALTSVSADIVKPRPLYNPCVFILLSNDSVPETGMVENWRNVANDLKKQSPKVWACWLSSSDVSEEKKKRIGEALIAIADCGWQDTLSDQKVHDVFAAYSKEVMATLQCFRTLTTLKHPPQQGTIAAPQLFDTGTDESSRKQPLASVEQATEQTVPPPAVQAVGPTRVADQAIERAGQLDGDRLPARSEETATSFSGPGHVGARPMVPARGAQGYPLSTGLRQEEGQNATRWQAPGPAQSEPARTPASSSPIPSEASIIPPVTMAGPGGSPEPTASAASASPVRRATWTIKEPEDDGDPSPHFHNKNAMGVGAWRMIGSSRRGRMHEQDGTFRDDEFDFGMANGWNLVAMADGAGSAKLSRIGAREAIAAAMAIMLDWTAKIQSDDEDLIRAALQEAMKAAHRSVLSLAKERSLPVKTFSATLLLLMHRPGEEGHLVGTLQVGDGYLAAQMEDGEVVLFGDPDSGEYSGETYFLTTKSAEAWLGRAQVQRLDGLPKMLAVMTDGVGDDFFPPQTNLPKLFRALSDTLADPCRVFKEELQTLKEGQMDKLRFSWPSNPADFFSSWPREAIDPADVFKRALAVTSEGSSISFETKSNADKYWMPPSKPDVAEALYLLIGYRRKASFDDRSLAVIYRHSGVEGEE